jgi:hypothetical protein
MASKGLKSNVVDLFGGTILGISSVAQAYAQRPRSVSSRSASAPRHRW